MTPSQACVDLVKEFEGFYAKAYLCPANVWTIGYGTTKYPDGNSVKPGDQCTRSAAEAWLAHDLSQTAKAVSMLVQVPIEQHQFDALVSFAYNVGTTAFQNSTMRKFINAAMFKDAAGQFPRWVRGGGRVLPGLVKRRAEEQAMFLGEHA